MGEGRKEKEKENRRRKRACVNREGREKREKKRKERKRKGERVSDVSVCEWLRGDKPIFSQPTVC
jgi:hypothetical protein